MKVFAIAGPKGGCGKSTLSSALVVRATVETGKVALIDLDESQATLTEWWTVRGKPVNPFLYSGDGTLDWMVDALAADRWTYCFIDGPPYEQDLIEMSVVVASVVLIPVKLAYFDATTIDSIVSMCKGQKPYAFVINEFDGRKIFDSANSIGLEMLRGRGPILESRMSYHPKNRVGQIKGQTGAELDKGLAKEVDALWNEVKQLAGIGLALKVVEGGRG